MNALIFYGFGTVALAAAAFAVFGRYRDPWLGPQSFLIAMVSIGAAFLSLGAQLLGAAQIFLYAGALTALLVCLTSILPHPLDESSFRRTLQVRRLLAGLVIGAVAALLLGIPLGSGAPAEPGAGFGDLAGVGLPLFSAYLIPLEAGALLLLAAAVSVAIFARSDAP